MNVFFNWFVNWRKYKQFVLEGVLTTTVNDPSQKKIQITDSIDRQATVRETCWNPRVVYVSNAFVLIPVKIRRII